MTVLVFVGLIALSFFTSMLSASMGIGGGSILLAVMAQVVPVKAIIPVHGMVQLGSNVGRSIIMLSHVNWLYLLWFFAGSVFGALLGGQLVVSLPADTLRFVLACFILFSVWGPEISSRVSSVQSLAVGGLFSTILTMFVGATGPFVLSLYRALALPRLALVATNAASLVVQHALKVITFALLGFVYSPYLWFILLMVASGFLGTIMGRYFLLKIDEKLFQSWIKIILTILAIRLLFLSLHRA